MLINTSGRQNHKINDQFSVIKVTKGQTCDSAISKIHVMRHTTCEVSWFYEKKHTIFALAILTNEILPLYSYILSTCVCV